MSLFEAVLPSEAYQGDFVLVIPSELLDAVRFAPADGSVGRPEPEENRLGFQSKSPQVDASTGEVGDYDVGII